MVTNPASLLRADASLAVGGRRNPLRGEAKLRAALTAFALDVRGHVALDVGAAAGGFTRALLDAGAARVYAVDAGHGQLLGSLRQDARVVSLERVNVGELDRRRVPDAVEVVTIDVSYLSLAQAVPQLDRVELAPRCELVALVKPQFELGRAGPPAAGDLPGALGRAEAGIAAAGWEPRGSIESPVTGAGGAVEFLVHARLARARRRPYDSARDDGGLPWPSGAPRGPPAASTSFVAAGSQASSCARPASPRATRSSTSAPERGR